MDPSQMLPAPQAGLMAAVAQGLRGAKALPWDMVSLGIFVGVLIIIADEVLRRYYMRLPSLAVGLGIYLPTEVMVPIVLGGIVSYFVNRNIKRHDTEANLGEHHARQWPVMLACGLVAGSALMGVFLAIPFVLMGSSNALRLVPVGFTPIATILGILVLGCLAYWLMATSKRSLRSDHVK